MVLGVDKGGDQLIVHLFHQILDHSYGCYIHHQKRLHLHLSSIFQLKPFRDQYQYRQSLRMMTM